MTTEPIIPAAPIPSAHQPATKPVSKKKPEDGEKVETGDNAKTVESEKTDEAAPELDQAQQEFSILLDTFSQLETETTELAISSDAEVEFVGESEQITPPDIPFLFNPSEQANIDQLNIQQFSNEPIETVEFNSEIAVLGPELETQPIQVTPEHVNANDETSQLVEQVVSTVDKSTTTPDGLTPQVEVTAEAPEVNSDSESTVNSDTPIAKPVVENELKLEEFELGLVDVDEVPESLTENQLSDFGSKDQGQPNANFSNATNDAAGIQATNAKNQVQLFTASETTPTSIVTEQTIDRLQTEIPRLRPPTVQSIEIQIDPPELGFISIQIEVTPEQINAQIVASELASAELLQRDRQILNEILSDIGYSQTNVDISHGFDESNPGERETDEGFQSAASDGSLESESGTDSWFENSVEVVGVNLVA